MLQEQKKCHSACCDSSQQEAVITPEITGQRLSWKISGMDCPSCASKVENAVKNIDGVSQARVAFATERLLVVANDDDATQQRILEAVNDAGFEIANESSGDEKPQGFFQKYWRILVLASLVVIAALIKGTFPVVGDVLFYAATIWGLYPVTRQAFNLARNGSPFSIETLMSVAAIGALFLGKRLKPLWFCCSSPLENTSKPLLQAVLVKVLKSSWS